MMANTTLTLALDGEVPLKQFASAMQGLWGLIDALDSEVAEQEEIEWVIDELQAGSALATIRGESVEEYALMSVVHAYAEVGEALQEGQVIPFPDRVVRAARSITRVLNGKITAIRFETPTDDFTVVTSKREKSPARIRSLGAITGRVQTLTNRGTLRFSLYDTVFDRAVSCYLQKGQEEMMRGIWGHYAVVEGLVSRSPSDGRPETIRQIVDVTRIADVDAGAYLHARGIVPIGPGDELPEDVIRRLRDAL